MIRRAKNVLDLISVGVAGMDGSFMHTMKETGERSEPKNVHLLNSNVIKVTDEAAKTSIFLTFCSIFPDPKRPHQKC